MSKVKKLTPLTKTQALHHVATIEKYLSKGCFPPSKPTKKGDKSAVNEAAESLGINRKTLRERVQDDGYYERKFEVKVDWTKYKHLLEADPIQLRRLADDRAKAEQRARIAERIAVTSESLREHVFKIKAQPLTPPSWTFSKRASSPDKYEEALVMVVSDIHMGEVIDLAQMGGRNSYNRTIAANRMKRLFENTIKLGTKHWTGPPPGVLYVILMGDMVSGNIHEELQKTNDLLIMPAVREATRCIVAGLQMLLDNFDCEIRVISVPGNHGRNTRKPEAKDFAIDSYDTLITWNVESWFSALEETRLTFSAPLDGDALVNINGWNFLFTHGDRIGSRGGMGFIGPAATIARGMQKVIQDYAAEGTIVDFVVVGHFHTSLELEQGFANGCLCGPSEFSRMLRLRPAPASQWLLAVHPIHGISRRWKVEVGSPDEGLLYRGKISA